ncbi:RNaseH domain-containing protein [Nocardia sp. NPDC050712]|uniref:RNaseH domain-containing protein n=1 Tax=Nocardia sp. NPDC050712 TaxID=3155518 RepID=UPI003400F212
MNQSEPGLHTLDFRIDPAVLGSLVLYPMTADFSVAWERFVSAVRRKGPFSPRYSNLATALTAVTGQPVGLFPARELSGQQKEAGTDSLLITTAPIDPWLLATAVRSFEHLHLTGDQSDYLATDLVDSQLALRAVADYAEVVEGTIRAPGWLYKMAQWNLAATIAAEPLTIDDHLPISLRLDTTGNLIAWDDPITRTWSNGQHHATIYISTHIVTLPGAAGLYLRLDGHVARMPNSWWDVKNAWVAPSDTMRPILRLPVRGPWPDRGRPNAEYSDFVAEIVNSCELDPLPTLPDTFGGGPGSVRLIGKPSKHPVGKGPGARTLFQLHRQVRDRLGLQDLVYKKTKISVPKQIEGAVPPDKIDTAIIASGIKGLRVLCLYGDRQTRHRMLDTLAEYSSKDVSDLVGFQDGEPVEFTSRLSAVFHRDESLLAHGSHERDLHEIPHVHAEPDAAVVAWVETRWKDEKITHDAKPPLRSGLANLGVVAQFLDANNPPAPPRRLPDGTVSTVVDYPAVAGLRDLLRQAGVIDNRLAVATVGARTSSLTRDATLVGIHIRQHTPRRKVGRSATSQMVIRMVAIQSTPDSADCWSVQMYDDSEGWLPYREANARYHRGQIGYEKFGRTGAKSVLVRDHVDQALSSLPKRVPLAVFVDAEGAQSLWVGLTNARFGDHSLPGSSIRHDDLAVVRCASGHRTSRPSHQDHSPRVSDPHQPDLPGAFLYRHQEGDTESWMLAQPSRVHRSGAQGRAGTSHTRWTLPEKRERWMADDWHALTGIEISIPRPGGWCADELAALTARLCQQTVGWDDRTVLPAPLHLAKCADEDHPRYEQGAPGVS